MRVGEKLLQHSLLQFSVENFALGHRFIRSHTNQSSVLSHAHPRDRLSKFNGSVVAERVPTPTPKGTFMVSGQLLIEEIFPTPHFSAPTTFLLWSNLIEL